MESWKGEREKRFEAEKGEKKLRHIFLYFIYLYIGVILSQTRRIGYICFCNFAAECVNTCTY